MPSLHPTPDQLNQLKAPLGKLILGGPLETMPELKKIVGQLHPTRIITVGDVVTTEARAVGIRVDLGIIDGKTMRRQYDPQHSHTSSSVVHVNNPAGAITEGAWNTVKTALSKSNATLMVDGEEDLLTLPAVMEAPVGSIVVYGQPSQGIVIVQVTSEKKLELARIIEEWTNGRR